MTRALVLFALLIFSTNGLAEIREVPVENLNRIAWPSFDDDGPVIYYDPQVNTSAGRYISEFFRAHVYGHFVLGHLVPSDFRANRYYHGWQTAAKARAADCFAIQHASEAAARAIIYFIEFAQTDEGPSWYQKTGYDRVAALRSCGQ